jgi:hypothetical protein
MSFPSIHLSVTTTWTSDQTPDAAPGTVAVEGSDIYVLVKNTDATAIEEGAPAFHSSGVRGEAQELAGALNAQMAYGLAMSTIPAGGYGWVMARGHMTNAKNTGAAAGEPVKLGSDTTIDAVIGTDHIFGFASQAVSGGRTKIFIIGAAY